MGSLLALARSRRADKQMGGAGAASLPHPCPPRPLASSSAATGGLDACIRPEKRRQALASARSARPELEHARVADEGRRIARERGKARDCGVDVLDGSKLLAPPSPRRSPRGSKAESVLASPLASTRWTSLRLGCGIPGFEETSVELSTDYRIAAVALVGRADTCGRRTRNRHWAAGRRGRQIRILCDERSARPHCRPHPPQKIDGPVSGAGAGTGSRRGHTRRSRAIR